MPEVNEPSYDWNALQRLANSIKGDTMRKKSTAKRKRTLRKPKRNECECGVLLKDGATECHECTWTRWREDSRKERENQIDDRLIVAKEQS